MQKSEIQNEKTPDYECRTQVKYSNRDYVLLSKIIEQMSGKHTINQKYVAKKNWHPRGMTDTFYHPSLSLAGCQLLPADQGILAQLFLGTSVWIPPKNECFGILLPNRVLIKEGATDVLFQFNEHFVRKTSPPTV